MIRNFFIVAIRNLRRNRVFSTINILGLAVGMASAMLIGLWIQSEMSFDRFHAKEGRLYQIYRTDDADGITRNNSPKILATTFKNEFPEIEDVVRWRNTNFLFTVGDHHFNLPGNFTDSGFLEMFSFPLLEGNLQTALHSPNDIVITESLAKKLFGKEPAMGQQIKIDSSDLFTVKAVLKDLPENTQFNFEYLLPWSYMKKIGWDDDRWQLNSVRTFYTLKPGISAKHFDAKIRDLIRIRTRDDRSPSTTSLFGYPASKWHLYSRFENGKQAGGQIDTVRLFMMIAGFILLIACINFMNLSTARSEKRVKEVGVRKVVGASKSLLIGQFLAESVFFSLIAGMLALLIVELSLPSFNLLVHKKLALDFHDPRLWLTGCGFVLMTGLLAGSYPAFYLSSFKPIKVLKGYFNAGRQAATPRKFLVVIQFSFAMILIICTIVVKRQIIFAQNRDAGYDKNNLVYSFMQGEIDKNYELIRNELLSGGVALSAARTSGPMTQLWADTKGFQWPGSTKADMQTGFNFFSTDEHFVRTMGLKLTAGRDIDTRIYVTDSNAIMLTETAVKAMRLKNPVGMNIMLNTGSFHVVGTIRDFILESPYAPIAPMVIVGPSGMGLYVLNVKLNPAHSFADNLNKMEAIFKKYNPSYPFEYNFVDEEYANKFASEKRTGQLAGLFAGLTVFISCMGLFGLASFMAENRVKEIGIRKVLGASVLNITRLLSQDFLKLIFISFLIAAPIAWWYMNEWLQSYDYRIQISGWIFLFVMALTLLVALMTIGFQTVRAAMMNPSKSLRSE